MARIIRNSRLESRAARRRLEVRVKPYWQELEAGAHLGYVRKDHFGVWVVRFYTGKQQYAQEKIGTADDFAISIFSKLTVRRPPTRATASTPSSTRSWATWRSRRSSPIACALG